jgi:galactokinase/mevalonate kinase-like predicted kinase
VSLVGGGTDLPSYIRQLGYGEVISFPINKYIYITSNKYFDPKKL